MKPKDQDLKAIANTPYSDMIGMRKSALQGSPSGQSTTGDSWDQSSANANQSSDGGGQLRLAADTRSDDIRSAGNMSWLDNGAPAGQAPYYTAANDINNLQGDQGKFTPDRVAQIQNAIGVIRASGYPNAGKVASDLNTMLNNGTIYIDPTLPKDTNGATNLDIRKSSGVTLNLNPQLFTPNYLGTRSTNKPNMNWRDDAELSITLLHEYQHAALQPPVWKIFHRNEIEDRAYAAAQKYIGTLAKSNPNYANSSWVNMMNYKYITPQNER